jgi:hypothetical protein
MPLFSNEKYEISSQSAETFRCAIFSSKIFKTLGSTVLWCQHMFYFEFSYSSVNLIHTHTHVLWYHLQICDIICFVTLIMFCSIISKLRRPSHCVYDWFFNNRIVNILVLQFDMCFFSFTYIIFSLHIIVYPSTFVLSYVSQGSDLLMLWWSAHKHAL